MLVWVKNTCFERNSISDTCQILTRDHSDVACGSNCLNKFFWTFKGYSPFQNNKKFQANSTLSVIPTLGRHRIFSILSHRTLLCQNRRKHSSMNLCSLTTECNTNQQNLLVYIKYKYFPLCESKWSTGYLPLTMTHIIINQWRNKTFYNCRYPSHLL